MKEKPAVLKIKVKDFFLKCKNMLFNAIATVKKFKIKKVTKTIKNFFKKTSKIVSDTWKPLVIGVPSFLFCYYVFGALISENISVEPVNKSQNENSAKSKVIETMQSILNREVDKHIWTPNVPLVFPAYVLDNMPNFQIGAVSCVKDSVKIFKNFAVDDEDKKTFESALKFLDYPPDVWLLAQKSAFNIAPSSNSQYRKARKELEKIDGYSIAPENLRLILKNMAKNLQNLSAKNEERVREFSSNFVDLHDDDLFYYNKGYAFSLWQICDSLAVDFKQIILAADAYADWTMLKANLQKAAQFEVSFVRNGEPDSLFAPNHLLGQNYYLSTARAEAEKINNRLGDYYAGAN